MAKGQSLRNLAGSQRFGVTIELARILCVVSDIGVQNIKAVAHQQDEKAEIPMSTPRDAEAN
jgi:hypothetical protein